ncbi:sulfatase-like hydrolase/transferase [bacterium]|nr:sulfatase-like hydrolase/transferase [bacterium]
MSTNPNIILFITDQQRADTINALGAPWMITPTLDRLVKEGTSFTRCYTTSPVCVAARASLFTGYYPHSTGTFTNFQPWEPTWVQQLADTGYHCVNMGKMHINPYDKIGGFHQRYPIENKDRPLFLDEHRRAWHDEWDKALHARNLIKPSRYNRLQKDPDHFSKALGCFPWEIDEDMHPDMFLGDMVQWWLEERVATAPLFLQIGFPGPHPPYDPSKRYLSMYDDVEIPFPGNTDEELEAQPAAIKNLRKDMQRLNIDSIAWKDKPSREEILRIRRHYAANVTMIDEKIGQIMNVLERKGYLENAIVIFTSDHGDALGDHGCIQKWNMYESSVNVPLIVWSPDCVPAGRITESLVQLFDLAPTILAKTDVPVPDAWEAESLWPIIDGESEGRDAVYSELARDHIQLTSEYMIMRRDKEWKLVWYAGDSYGDLFHLPQDPDEKINLWDDPDYRDKRDQLLGALQEWLVMRMLRANMKPTEKPQQAMSID